MLTGLDFNKVLDQAPKYLRPYNMSQYQISVNLYDQVCMIKSVWSSWITILINLFYYFGTIWREQMNCNTTK